MKDVILENRTLFPTMAACRTHFRIFGNPKTHKCVPYQVDFGYRYRLVSLIPEPEPVIPKPNPRKFTLEEMHERLEKLKTEHKALKKITYYRQRKTMEALSEIEREELSYNTPVESAKFLKLCKQTRERMVRYYESHKVP